MESKTVEYFSGRTAGEASMPTCGVCNAQIARDGKYAVVSEPGFKLREVRHPIECESWSRGYAGDLAAGDLLWSHRFAVSAWGGRIRARVVKRTEELDGKGWRGWDLEPADPSDTSPLDGLRATGNEGLIREANEIGSIDPAPRRVWLPDRELVHFKRTV